MEQLFTRICKSAYFNFLSNDWNRSLQTRIINLFSYRLADTYHAACLKTKVLQANYIVCISFTFAARPSGLFGVDFFNLRAMSTTLEHCSHYTARTYLNTYFPLYSSISKYLFEVFILLHKYFKYLKVCILGENRHPTAATIYVTGATVIYFLNVYGRWVN